jgi:sarcosine oxidase
MGESRSFDVAVIGVGAMGSAACYHLARRGAAVLGLDRFSIPSAMGSSHGDSRIIRLCYFEHPDYTPLLQRAYELWRDLESESGEHLMATIGGVFVGPRDGACLAGTIRAARSHGLPHEVIAPGELGGRFPQIQVPADHMAVFEPQAGALLPERAIGVHAEMALRYGAELHGHEPVREIAPAGEELILQTDVATYRAGHVVVCAGAWSQRLLGELGVELPVTRQVVGWFWPRRPELFRPPRLGVWAIDQPDGGLLYGFPCLPGRPGLKLGLHVPGDRVDPDSTDRMTRPEEQEELRALIRRNLPEADGPLLSLAACLYTNSPDGHFIIDAHPARRGVSLACGFSGHGFKFAPVVGEILADLALSGTTAHPIDFLRLARFGAG